MRAFKYVGPEKDFNLRGTVFVAGKPTPVEDESLAAKCSAMTGSFQEVIAEVKPPAGLKVGTEGKEKKGSDK